MKIEIGKTYMFTKSGNLVRVVARAGKRKDARWTVERVDGASAGNLLMAKESALALVPVA